ncbi:MAG: hypothetical protein RBT11_20030 [Desulfobacterales bacterium]|jgi:hypothetical protein|nr:hypothetical protein [Desulfobacterales bacterium]
MDKWDDQDTTLVGLFKARCKKGFFFVNRYKLVVLAPTLLKCFHGAASTWRAILSMTTPKLVKGKDVTLYILVFLWGRNLELTYNGQK